MTGEFVKLKARHLMGCAEDSLEMLTIRSPPGNAHLRADLLELLTSHQPQGDLLEFLTFARGGLISWKSSPLIVESPFPGNPHHPGTAHL